MKVFISSLITGMAAERAAVEAAVQSLGHIAIKAEDFPPSPASPQKACLAAVRESNAVALVLGQAYGATQASGMSATHEEFLEARDRAPLFVFVTDKAPTDDKQAAFIAEARGWLHGTFTGQFKSPAQLQTLVTKALHNWELTQAAGTVDAKELIARADALLPDDRRSHFTSSSAPLVLLGISAGPTQAVLRPAALEAPSLGERLNQMAVFGRGRIFSAEHGVIRSLEGDALFLRQKDAYVSLNGEGSIALALALPTYRDTFPMIIEEDVLEILGKGLAFASEALDHVDSPDRLSHIAIATQLRGGTFFGWRTRREQNANPHSGSFGLSRDETDKPVHLSPPQRPRAAIRHQAQQIAEDLMVLLRRQAKAGR